MKFKPLKNRVIIKVIKDQEEQTRSGLFIPGTAKQMIVRAEVIAVGIEVKEVKVRDIVQIYKAAIPAELPFSKEGYCAVIEEQIILVEMEEEL